jgi:hypothetical protein
LSSAGESPALASLRPVVGDSPFSMMSVPMISAPPADDATPRLVRRFLALVNLVAPPSRCLGRAVNQLQKFGDRVVDRSRVLFPTLRLTQQAVVHRLCSTQRPCGPSSGRVWPCYAAHVVALRLALLTRKAIVRCTASTT